MLMANPPRRKPGRAKRYAQRALIGFGALLGFVFLTVVGLLVSLRFAKVRNLVVNKVNSALAGSFQGQIKLHNLGSVGLGGIGAADAEIFDPAGRRVIDIQGVDVHLSVPTIAWAAITHSSQPLSLRFDSISVKHVEVLLVDDGKGSPTLADAFLPKKPSPPSSGPGTIIVIDKALIEHAWVHGSLASTPPLDVELKDALGSLRVDETATTVAFKKASIEARGLPRGVDPAGQLRASLVLPGVPAKPIGAKAHYEGTAANIPLVLDASFIDNTLAATVDASNISPEAVSKQLPSLELRSPASLHLAAAGKLPDVHGDFWLGVGSGKVEGDFQATVANDTRVKANLHTQDLNVADLMPTAPASRLDVTLRAGALIPQTGPVTGNFALNTEPSVVVAERVPAIALTGTFSADSKAKRNRVEAHAEIAEPGAQTSIDATVEQSSKTNVEFKTVTKIQNPPRLKRLAALASAQGELAAQGRYQVESSSLNADLSGDLRNVRQGANYIARAKLTAKVSGALPHPNANVLLDVTDADLSGQHVTSAQVAVRGSLSHVAVTAEVATRAPERHVQLSAYVSNTHGIIVDHPSLNLNQGENHLKISANTVEVVDGHTRVNGLHLDGAGKADASLVYGPGLESANVQTYDLDLARLYRMIDPQAPLRSGIATASVNYDRRNGNPRARINAHGQDLNFGRVKGGALEADLDLDDGQLNGSANADLKHLGRVSFDFQSLRGINVDDLEPAHIVGKVAVQGQMQLGDLNELLPRDSNWPIARMLGSVTYDLAIERTRAGTGLPTLHAHVSTKGLQLAGARTSKTTINTKAEAIAAAPVAVKGIDLDVDMTHEETGETELAASIADERGRLAALSIEGKATPHMATVATELASQWKEIPLSVKLTFPPRDLQQLPAEVRPAALAGIASAELTYDGTFSAPKLELVGKVDDLRQDSLSKKRMNFAFEGSYDGLHGKFDGTARSGNRDVAKASLDFETAVTAWLDKTGDTQPPLDANAQVSFDAFPIALLPGTATTQVDGALSGKLALQHFGKDATVDGTFDANALKIGGSPFGNIHGEMKALNGKADALLRVDGDHGTTTAEAHSGVAWGARYVPEVKLPADAQLRAKDLRIGAFSPLVSSLFGELDGRLNGDLNAHFRGGAPELDGHVDLQDGVAQVASIGQRFDQVKARLSLESGKAKLEELSARPTAGRIAVTGEAGFEGLNLTGAEAHVRMTKSEAVAMTLSGTEITGTYGAIDLSVTPNPTTHANTVKVNIPNLHVGMPDTGSQDLQDLDPAKGVRVGVYQRTGGFVTLALQPLKETDPSKNDNPMLVDVHIGTIELQRGDMLKAQVNGDLRMVMGEPMTMTGEIDLQGGKLDVSGKQFEIESGTVTFSGEPANPTIVATARWDAADDDKHQVYADFTGTATKGKIVLRSEPPLTQDQILSLLLTGSADGSLGGGSTGGGSSAATAIGAVGGSATQGLNKVLSGISSVDVSTRIDTSTGSARPEIVIQISPRVAAQITRELGTPPPTDPPDLTFLTFDFRIKSHWSLDALVGDRGESGLDLVWRKRY
jgi:translocation and assembly module TamB